MGINKEYKFLFVLSKQGKVVSPLLINSLPKTFIIFVEVITSNGSDMHSGYSDQITH